MSTAKSLLAGSLLAIAMAGEQPAHAEPLTPLTPAEVQYLDQLHHVLRLNHDPIAFRSDGELLDRGRVVCKARNLGQVGEPATLNPPGLTQLAFIYLCPS